MKIGIAYEEKRVYLFVQSKEGYQGRLAMRKIAGYQSFLKFLDMTLKVHFLKITLTKNMGQLTVSHFTRESLGKFSEPYFNVSLWQIAFSKHDNLK